MLADQLHETAPPQIDLPQTVAMFGYLHQVLVYDPSRTNVKVAYFGITHLTFRQTDILSRSKKPA